MLTVHGSSRDGSPSDGMDVFGDGKRKQKDEDDSTETSIEDDSEESSSGESTTESEESESEEDTQLRWWHFVNDETEHKCKGDTRDREDCFLKHVARLFTLTQAMTKEEVFEAVKASAEMYEEKQDFMQPDEAIEAAINLRAPKILKFMDPDSDEEMEDEDDTEEANENDNMEQSDDDDEETADPWALINAKCEELYEKNQRLSRESCFLKAYRYLFFVADDFQKSDVYGAIDSSRRKLLKEDKYLDKSEAVEAAVIIRKRNILKFMDDSSDEKEESASD